MKLYRLNIMPRDTAGEGEVWDEWFSSLAAAKEKRKWYIANDRDVSYCDENYSIDRVAVPVNLKGKSLLLAALNSLGRWPSKEVVKTWKPK